MVQWLRVCAPIQGPGFNPWLGELDPQNAKFMILQAAAKTEDTLSAIAKTDTAKLNAKIR